MVMPGTIEQTTLPDGNKWDYTCDTQNQISTGELTDGNTTLFNQTYSYDPFGYMVYYNEVVGHDFVFKFSTKMLTNFHLYYYGYRFYNPKTKTWLTRDPIGELGDVNLHNFALNNGVNYWDELGLLKETVTLSWIATSYDEMVRRPTNTGWAYYKTGKRVYVRDNYEVTYDWNIDCEAGNGKATQISGNLKKSLDSFGLAAFILGWNRSYTSAVISHSYSKPCPDGYNGKKVELEIIISVNRTDSYGVVIGITIFSIDTGISYSDNKEMATKTIKKTNFVAYCVKIDKT